MMPMPGAMEGPPVEVGPGAAAGGPQAGPGPEEIKGTLVQLLSKAKEMAEANGLDFDAIVSQVTSAKVKSDVPLPRPPGMPRSRP